MPKKKKLLKAIKDVAPDKFHLEFSIPPRKAEVIAEWERPKAKTKES